MHPEPEYLIKWKELGYTYLGEHTYGGSVTINGYCKVIKGKLHYFKQEMNYMADITSPNGWHKDFHTWFMDHFAIKVKNEDLI